MQLSTGGRDQCLCTYVCMQAYAVQMSVCMEPCAGTVCTDVHEPCAGTVCTDVYDTICRCYVCEDVH